MSRLFHDVRVAARTLSRSRFVSVLALVAFALGIGVTTAVFSIFNGVLLKPLPFNRPDRIVSVYDTQPACSTCPASFPKFHAWKTRNQVFSAIGGSTGASLVLTGHGDPARVPGMATSAGLVDVFGVPPAMGRCTANRKISPADPRLSSSHTTSGRSDSAAIQESSARGCS